MHDVNSALFNLQIKDPELPHQTRKVGRTYVFIFFLNNSFYVHISCLFCLYYLKYESKEKFVAEQSYGNSASLDHMLNNGKDAVGLNCDAHTSRGTF
jgi:hypothetical protein